MSVLAWQNDPKPTVIIMYHLEGINESTGHQWRFFQGLNFTYLPRSIRRRFIKEWLTVLERNKGDVRFTWEMVKRKYPSAQIAIRRYFTKPVYYIQNFKEVPPQDIEKVVISTWSKDFSKKVRKNLLSTFRNVMRRRKRRIGGR